MNSSFEFGTRVPSVPDQVGQSLALDTAGDTLSASR
jgi:hypothetical protein